MKAKIKKTGEIVNIAEYATIALDAHDSWGNPIEMKPEEVELIQEQTEDKHCDEDKHWNDVRERAAIAAMQGILCSPSIKDIVPNLSSKVIAKCAVMQADVLIKELKNK